MFEGFKLMKLRSSLKDQRNLEAAFTAVQELGKIKSPKAVDLLIESLGRKDNVARSAARELGRIGDPRAAGPLADLLSHPKLRQSAQEGLTALGTGAVAALLVKLRDADAAVRGSSAQVLGEIGDKQAVEPLVDVLSHDNDYEVRVAAATALGQLQDQRAVWVLVGTLKLRDESTSERQEALTRLQQAAEAAMRKMGSPLIDQSARAGQPVSAEEAVARMEREMEDTRVHPRLLGDPGLLSEEELVGVLKELMAASEEISWAKLESREPLLASYFKNYDQRRETADKVGRELFRRGGRALLDQVLGRDLNQYASIKNWWLEIE